MFRIMRKLKSVKYEVKDWPKKHIGNAHDKLAKTAQKIDFVEQRLLSNPNSHIFNSWMQHLLKQREKLLLFNQKYWDKMAQKEWLANCDRNSEFFTIEQTLEGRGN